MAIHTWVSGEKLLASDLNNNFAECSQIPWTYYSKVSWSAESGSKDFSSLPAHDEWCAVMTIDSDSNGDFEVEMTINDIGGTAYNMSVFGSSNSATYQNTDKFRIISKYSTLNDYRTIVGEIRITGTHNGGRKGVMGVGITTGYWVDYKLAVGDMSGDSNDVEKIAFNLTGSGTGQVELYFRDKR